MSAPFYFYSFLLRSETLIISIIRHLMSMVPTQSKLSSCVPDSDSLSDNIDITHVYVTPKPAVE